MHKLTVTDRFRRSRLRPRTTEVADAAVRVDVIETAGREVEVFPAAEVAHARNERNIRKVKGKEEARLTRAQEVLRVTVAAVNRGTVPENTIPSTFTVDAAEPAAGKIVVLRSNRL